MNENNTGKMRMVNTEVAPPFFWINQWRPFFTCCWLHHFTPLEITIGRGRTGGLHAFIVVVICGIGFRAVWYDRNDRAKFLAAMDQLQEIVKDIVREEIPGVVFEGEEDGE